MSPRSQHQHQADGPRRRRRAPRPLDVFAVVPEARSAAAMDDEQEALALMADLAALVEAGLVVPVEGEGGLLYAPADPDDLTA